MRHCSAVAADEPENVHLTLPTKCHKQKFHLHNPLRHMIKPVTLSAQQAFLPELYQASMGKATGHAMIWHPAHGIRTPPLPPLGSSAVQPAERHLLGALTSPHHPPILPSHLCEEVDR